MREGHIWIKEGVAGPPSVERQTCRARIFKLLIFQVLELGLEIQWAFGTVRGHAGPVRLASSPAAARRGEC